MTTSEAIREAFTVLTIEEIREKTKSHYNTVTSWKFKFKHNQLSLEKQIEILTKLNYKINSNLTWKKENQK